MKQKTSINYVNNEDFYNRLKEWKESNVEKIPDDIALTLLKICENLAKSGKFCGYTWKEEMIGDAIFSCCKFAKNFNPEKSFNPFAYFTQIAYHSFIKRIQIENQKLATLTEYRDQLSTLYDLQEIDEDDSNNTYNSIDNTAKRINRTYIKPKKKQKASKKTLTIEDLI